MIMMILFLDCKQRLLYIWIYSRRVLSIRSDPYQALKILTQKHTKKNYRKWKWDSPNWSSTIKNSNSSNLAILAIQQNGFTLIIKCSLCHNFGNNATYGCLWSNCCILFGATLSVFVVNFNPFQQQEWWRSGSCWAFQAIVVHLTGRGLVKVKVQGRDIGGLVVALFSADTNTQ